eukprot:524909_1
MKTFFTIMLLMNTIHGVWYSFQEEESSHILPSQSNGCIFDAVGTCFISGPCPQPRGNCASGHCEGGTCQCQQNAAEGDACFISGLCPVPYGNCRPGEGECHLGRCEHICHRTLQSGDPCSTAAPCSPPYGNCKALNRAATTGFDLVCSNHPDGTKCDTCPQRVGSGAPCEYTVGTCAPPQGNCIYGFECVQPKVAPKQPITRIVDFGAMREMRRLIGEGYEACKEFGPRCTCEEATTSAREEYNDLMAEYNYNAEIEDARERKAIYALRKERKQMRHIYNRLMREEKQ